MRITIKDVAKLANVSPATVSLVLNDRPGVNGLTRERVKAAVEKLGYRPNQIARSLIMKKSLTLGFVVTNIHNPFYGDLVHHMQKEIDETSYNLILGISDDRVVKEKRAIESMAGRGVDGIILVPTRDGEQNLSHLYDLRSLNIPFLFVTSEYNGIQADCIMSDFEQATYELVTHLLEAGERKIYFLTETKSLLLSSERIAGYERAYKEKGINYQSSWVIEVNATVENGVSATEEILKQEMPDAIITINALLSLGVMKILLDRKIKVPEQISVASFDDLAYSSILYKPLTTVKQPMKLMCKRAIAVLHKRIEGEEMPYKRELLKTEMVIRDSTK